MTEELAAAADQIFFNVSTHPLGQFILVLKLLYFSKLMAEQDSKMNFLTFTLALISGRGDLGLL